MSPRIPNLRLELLMRGLLAAMLEDDDMNTPESLSERVFQDINGGMSALVMYVGWRLGLFSALADMKTATAEELAARTQLSVRYVQEWLGAMAAGKYIDVHDDRFSLSAAQRAVFVEERHGAYALASVGFLPSLASVLPKLLTAFRTGGGVPFEDYGEDLVDAQGAGYRPMFESELISRWIPALPDIEARLRAGGRVLDVGCGVGWSTILLAQAFPGARIDAVEPDARSAAAARRNAREAHVHVNVIEKPIEDAPLDASYDLVTLFECVHDMAHPVRALEAVRRRLADGGAVLISDERVGETLEENMTFTGQLYYNFSVLHCLPQSMAHDHSACTGAVMKPSIMKRYAESAGFTRFDILAVDNPLFRLYRLG